MRHVTGFFIQIILKHYAHVAVHVTLFNMLVAPVVWEDDWLLMKITKTRY